MYSFGLRACLFTIALSVLVAGMASATPLLAFGDEGIGAERLLPEATEQLRDPGGAFTIETVQEAPFAPVGRKTAGFGYTTDVIWLRFRLRNDSAAGADWRLHFRSNFLPEFALWQVDTAGSAELRERHVPGTVFGDRAIPYPEIVAPLIIPSGAETTIYIRYSSGGTSKLSFSLVPAERFAALAATRDARNFAYYGMMAFLVTTAFLACAFTGRAIFASYAAYAGSALLYIMHSDGNAFRYLWPDAPAFNGYVSVLLGSGIIVFGAIFARLFLRTPVYHPLLNVLLTGTIVATFILIGVTAFGATQTVKQLLVLLSFLSILLFAISGFVAARRRFREVRFYIIAWTGALVASGIMTGRHWLGIDLSEELQFDLMRMVLIVDAAMMGLAIIDSVSQIRSTQQAALERSLREARRNLDLSQRLAELERNHALALSLAKANQRRLADTAHDLRQPLAALRLNVQRMMQNPAGQAGSTPLLHDFEENFDYLEKLVASELNQQGLVAEEAAQAQEEEPTDYPVDDVLTSVVHMLSANAEAAGLQLRHLHSTARTRLPQMALMRVASNLLDNAIKYTPEGRVLIGARWRAGKLWLEVHDTGVGIPEGAFERARARSVRLESAAFAEGAGLGLAIVDDIARTYGLELSLCPNRRSGTGIRISLPAATGTAPPAMG